MGQWESAGQSDEWYTPHYIFKHLGEVFDLDVAAPKGGAPNVPTMAYISENSLSVPWHGFVWMNPPFGGRNGLVPWLEKFDEHGNGIALVPDRTSAPWFQRYAARSSAILFISPKVKFERPDGTVGRWPSTGTALLGMGRRARLALDRGGRSLGLLVEPA